MTPLAESVRGPKPPDGWAKVADGAFVRYDGRAKVWRVGRLWMRAYAAAALARGGFRLGPTLYSAGSAEESMRMVDAALSMDDYRNRGASS